MIRWMYYPKSRKPTRFTLNVVEVFRSAEDAIDSASHDLKSDEVLLALRQRLEALDFQVEKGKTRDERIEVPVLFGLDGRAEKSFQADAHHEEEGFVLEVEAGRAVLNNQFLKDLFQACMMHGVGFLGIAVRNTYKQSNDFERVCRFFDTLYASSRLQLPLDGILVIGY